MVDNLEFSQEEIQEQLAVLGYKNIPKHRLVEFKQDLEALIQRGEWMNLDSPSQCAGTSQLSPPAYSKEKGSEPFFSKPNKDNDGWVPPNHQNTAHGQRGNTDSYSQHSVAKKLQLPRDVPNQLQMVTDMEETPNSVDYEGHVVSPSSQGYPFRRKVLRKYNGQLHVCDESVYSEDSDVASSLEDQLSSLQLSPSAQGDEDDTDLSQNPPSEADDESVGTFELYMRGTTRTLNHCDLRPKPKSFIRPIVSQRTIKKTDPVAKYFQYKQLWDMFKCPGEADRRALRWEIKEQLVYQPPPPKPPKVCVPNTYIVPTEKKRSKLRWEVRNALANRLPPYKFSYPF